MTGMESELFLSLSFSLLSLLVSLLWLQSLLLLFLLSSSSSSLLLLSSSSSSFYYYYYYYYYYCHYSVNNIPYQCDITCAGHFTLDALASRTVACVLVSLNVEVLVIVVVVGCVQGSWSQVSTFSCYSHCLPLTQNGSKGYENNFQEPVL